eukprot:TRINITY_DN1755_c0_g1_i4.p1 TRINITY_DN1755_c0_g1~~TRINITY_DN1755_c0_g1_i4.p1  ORF type:complete len:251 (+),score=122.69 TRINITY_DN1755_c0_g1_i4:101-754(+)
MTSTKLDETPDVKSEEFDLDVFISQKMGKVNSKNEKKIISDSSNSSLADLVKFNTTLAYSFYKITDDNCLETCLLSLQPEEDIKMLDVSPSVTEAWKEVAMYRDLLLLGDLPTINQEKRTFEWIYSAPSLSTPAMEALMVSFITISMKLTGKKPSRLNMKMPGGKISGKKREEVVSYLAIIQTIADSMNQRNKWEKEDKSSILRKMNQDLNKIINDF